MLPRQVEELIVEIMTRDESAFLPQRCEDFVAGLRDAGYVIAPADENARLTDEVAIWKDRYESLLRDAAAAEKAWDQRHDD